MVVLLCKGPSNCLDERDGDMRNLWNRIWNSEPVVFVGAVVSAWMALVAFDQGIESWEIPLWAYIVAVPVTAFLTGITRQQVTPVDNES
jgi:hypothetical protein